MRMNTTSLGNIFFLGPLTDCSTRRAISKVLRGYGDDKGDENNVAGFSCPNLDRVLLFFVPGIMSCALVSCLPRVMLSGQEEAHLPGDFFFWPTQPAHLFKLSFVCDSLWNELAAPCLFLGSLGVFFLRC